MILSFRHFRAVAIDPNSFGLHNFTGQEATEGVVNYWRDHVLRLLVQLEQATIERKHVNGRIERERAVWEQRRKDAQLELESMRLKLQASEAALMAARGRVEVLEEEVQKQSDRLHTLKVEETAERHKLVASFRSIKANLLTLGEKVKTFMYTPADDSSYQGSSVPELMRRLRQLERRLNFANNRLPLLRAHLALRAGMPVDQCDGWAQTDNILVPGCQSALNLFELEDLLVHTQTELKQCMAERDGALKTLEQNARSFRERVKNAEEEVHMELSSLRDLTTVLENTLKEKQEELNRCQIQMANLKDDHAKLQQETIDEQARLRTQLADAQKQLNKAMIELKRTERRVDRESDERRTRIAEVENTYKSRIHTLEQALRSFQPESYKWYSIREGIEQATANTTLDAKMINNVEDPTTATHLDALAASINQLARVADCLKSSSESSDHEGDVPKNDFPKTN
ncbi:unnamed protein product [Echinostoma caproni]|uniref:Uncharacterized protein n=1 Tax=Echinostoma caproni TaxID=27848 RepID=A0A183AD50_9TREM|nr:unnamed protein product [Echinostoma caproni]